MPGHHWHLPWPPPCGWHFMGEGVPRLRQALAQDSPQPHSRQEVWMVLDCVLQLLQEGQVRGLPGTQTLLVLGGWWQRVRGVFWGGTREHRDSGAPAGGVDTPSPSTQPCSVPHQAPRTLALCGQAGWESEGKGVTSSRPSPQRSRWLTNMEMMPLNFSSTRSQIILLLKYWTGSH